ncbi:Zinc finger BED domain-containing protein 5 [Araneus ventricosus]|uniref:Zinc finger BED domain-containing protein 5 n=1 Tax=Araneus ventricosus TaxID=182803 RepID=A0A4Y2MCI5_ARAVE|nr:Zinc finger BED domain-containing protein 5 [Araneus ventricosus]
MEASYKVSYRISLAGEAHVIGESLIKPCVQDIVSCVLGESYSKQVESVSLSNNTVKKRINDIADDIELELTSRLQACNAYVLQLDESTDVAGLAILLVFVRKIQYWISAVEQNNFECFQTLSDFLEESEVDLDMEIRDGIHLSSLQQSLSDYFPNLENQDNYWVQNPFKIKEKPKGFHSMDYENLIELSSDTQLEAKFRTVSLTIFWSDVFDEYPNLEKQAIRILLPLATNYFCEAGFSKYVATKTKYRNKLDAAPDMRIQLSNLMPNFKGIMESWNQRSRCILHIKDFPFILVYVLYFY